MAQINRANFATNLNTTTAWTGGVVPTATDIAAWGTPLITTGTAQALGGSVSWQGVLLQSAQTSAITIASTAGATLTLGTSGIDLSASGANLTVASLVALGPATQTWSVASGRTLTVSGQLTASAKNVTLSGAGSFSLTGANTTTWTNSTITVASGAYWNIANANGPGAATNSIVVEAGASAGTNQTILPASITLSGTGTGTAATRFAYHANIAQGAGRTFTFAGTRTMFLSMNSLTAATHAAKFTGTTSAETVLVAGNNTTLTNTSNDFVAGGNGVELQSYQTNGSEDGRWAIVLSGDVSDVATFGNVANNVYIETTGAFQTTAATANRTISRNFKIEGHTVTGGAPVAADIFNNSATKLNLTGTVNLLGTGGLAATFDSAIGGSVALAGTLTGAGNISVVAGGTVELATGLTLSSYTGNVVVGAATIKYGIGGVAGTATYATNAIIDNISGSTLTLAHSGYTLGGSLTFTGLAPMSLGGGNVTTAGATTFTVSANTLTVPGTITGTGTFTKAAIGNLTLDGATSGYGTYAHTGGTLTLNSNNALGSSTAILTITAAVANTLDSTLGATLANTGANTLQANFTWGGSADLTLGSGATSWNAARTISFLNGKTGTLKFAGNIGALGATQSLAVGGSPVGGSRSRLWLAGTNGMLALSNSVTAGYLRVSSSSGLGNAVATTWTVSSGAALELDGGISPTSARNVTITGPGPNTDGALRSVSGTNTWSGAIIPPVQSLASPTRIQVDAGTFTLDAGSSYPNIAPTVSNTPLQFTALGSTAVLNQPRQLTSFVSDVTINNGGVGTVVLSVANNHTGGTTVEGGTCKVTQINATSTGTVQVNASATLESTVQSQFTTLRLGSAGSGARAVLKFAA